MDTFSTSGPSRTPATYNQLFQHEDGQSLYDQHSSSRSSSVTAGVPPRRDSLVRRVVEDDGMETVLGGEPSEHRGHKHATVGMKKALWWRNVAVTGIFILCWYTFATLLSLYNKWMFSPQYYNFPYPLFVTSCHMVVQFAMAAIIRKVWAKKYRPAERPTRRQYLTKILPTAMSTGGDIGLSNLSLKTITLSLYTMCKSSTLIFVLLFAFFFQLEPYSLRLICVISLISFGVFCMVFNTTSVSVPGILMVFSASALGGLRWALTELVMHKKSMGLSNPFATIFWLAPLMAATLGGVSIFLEGWTDVFGSEFFEGGRALRTMGVIVLPGGIAFAMVASEYFIIQRAGVVPLSIAGIFKEVSTISISAWVFGDQLTAFNIIGVFITVTGIALYSYHKYQKSISSTVELDEIGKPVKGDVAGSSTPSLNMHYSAAPQDEPIDDVEAGQRGVQLAYLSSQPRRAHSPTPSEADRMQRERREEQAERLKDDFEGWDRSGQYSEDEGEDEIGEDEVQQRMEERQSGAGKRGRWTNWLDKEM